MAVVPSESEQEITPINILSEETFLDEMDKIIERDFFPDLPSVKSQLREDTPETRSYPIFRTPQSLPRTPARAKRKTEHHGMAKSCSKLSLNEYLQNYTSEDNFNFYKKLRHDSDEKHKAKYKWLYETKAAIENNRMNALMFHPDGVKSGNPKRLGISLKNTRTIRSTWPDVIRKGETSTEKKGDERRLSGRAMSLMPSPSPRPGAETPIMTWGEIKFTPLLIPGVTPKPMTPKSP